MEQPELSQHLEELCRTWSHRTVPGRLCTGTEPKEEPAPGQRTKEQVQRRAKERTATQAGVTSMYHRRSHSVTRGARSRQRPAQCQGENCRQQDAKWSRKEQARKEPLRGGPMGTAAQATGRGKGREPSPQGDKQNSQKRDPT